jgi:hypothetical protein
VEIDIGSEQVAEGVAVHVRVRLTPRELNRLFMAGDILIQLPADGSVEQSAGAPIPRTSIFLYELAGSQEGFTRIFADAAHAESFVTTVREQVTNAWENA